MKKLIGMMLLISAGPLIVSAQKLASSKVPAEVKAGLVKAHPGAVATWEWEDNDYEANFKEAGKEVSVVINKQGTILETETAITQAELPAAARDYVNQHFKGKKIQEVAKIAKSNGEVNYEVMVNNKDTLFDASGKVIVKKKEAKEKD